MWCHHNAGFSNIVEVKAERFLRSFPGSDNMGGIADHIKMRDIVIGKELDSETLRYISIM